MKKLLTIILLFISMSLSAQHNAIGIAFEDMDWGFGVRYDHLFYRPIGLYVMGTKGHYVAEEIGKIEHIKGEVGVVKYIPSANPKEYISFYSGGVSYNYYHQELDGTREINKGALFPVSVDVGAGFIAMDRVMFSLNYDFLKHDATLTLQIKW